MTEGSRSSSAEPTTPAWVRLAMPSVADLIFIALLNLLVFTPLSTRLLGDAGIGWHIRTGQQILATHAIPHVDWFSSTMSGKPWFAWEWLYDLVVGQLEASLGLNGVVWFTAVVIAAVFAWMFRLLIQRGTHAFVLVMLALSASMIHFLARPHVPSWLLTLAWFWILDSTEQDSFSLRGGPDRRRLWLLLPPLMLIWVNLHGGFLLGFVLLGIFWLGAVWTWFRAKESGIEDSLRRIAATRRAQDLLWAGLLAAAASLVNPYGWKLHAHVNSYLSNRFLMDHIEEFQSPNFHGVAQKCFLALLLIGLAVLAVRGRQLRMSQGLIVLFAVYAGLYASRNIPVSALLLGMVLGPLLAPTLGARSFFERMTAVESRLRGHAWPVIALVVTFSIAANGGRAGPNRLMNAHFDRKRMPVEAVSYLANHHLNGPLLSPDYWGGYLIYRLYPQTLVVLDDRHDLYGEEFFKSYLKMVHVEPGWEDFLREHESSCLLLPKAGALTDRLAESRAWKAIYSDDVAVAFVRSSANSHAGELR
jgi:hypothetical protein